jgi:uncharacterized membrane protein YphA (DoxX/SURF4 family)
MDTEQPAESRGALRLATPLLFALLFLRITIGWHFLYEGLSKLFNPGWSAAGYLASSRWILAELFHWISESPAVLDWVNFLNTWGLILIGAGLMLGVCTRVASFSGAALLLLYYLAHPPLIGMDAGGVAEGSYLVVNKNVVEMVALLLLGIVPRSGFGGLGFYLKAALAKMKTTIRRTNWAGESPLHRDPEGFSRRELIAGLASLPVLGGFVYAVLKKHPPRSLEESALQARVTSSNVDATTTPSVKIAQALSLDDLKEKVPHARLGDLDVSRLILGGNLMNGFAHARDLMYVSSLVKVYHTVDKVLETLWISEQCGMNALVLNTHNGGHFVEEYQKRNVGRMQFIAQCRAGDLMPRLKRAIDLGVKAAYIQQVDVLTDENKFDEVAQALELMRSNGLVAGYGSHYLSAIKKCVDEGLEPDFCMKTFHHLNYWSARPGDEEKDNRYCDDGEETVQFMKDFDKPWIAFKALAAGSIHPKDGLRYAFENGADFVCIGMYDFQVVEDANIVCGVLRADLQRDRPWRALA